MIRTAICVTAFLAALAVTPSQAADDTAGNLKISAPWARATPRGAAVGGGYLKITNSGKEADRMVGGSTDIAARFEVHEMSMDNGVMKMRMLHNGLEIKPGQTVEFKPSGYHLMFVGLKQQLNKGDHFKSTLVFEKAGKVDVDFAVEGIGAQTGGDEHSMPAASGGMKMQH